MLRFLWDSISLQMLFVFLFVFLLFYDYMKRRKPKDFPPRPFSFPFVGNLQFMFSKDPVTTTQKGSSAFPLPAERVNANQSPLISLPHPQFIKKHGDIFSTQVGSMSFVFVNGLQLIKEVLVTQGENFLDRPQFPVNTDLFNKFGELSMETWT
ncbi:UNVERIFIED_CONTAM: hypothetical protein H355_009017 [Colinus virginianus]|nr:hypothetical protein H355_009017 [Colinus virginianus]